MYAIKELTDTLGWSYNQIRDRILRLNDSIDDVLERGKSNKIYITEKGLSLLRKLKDLEEEGKSIESSVKTIVKDLQDDHNTGEEDTSKLNKSTPNQYETETLRERVEELKQDREYLKEQLEKRESRIDDLEQRLLPRERKSPFQRVWDWLGI